MAVKRLRRSDRQPSNIVAALLVALTLVLIFLYTIVAIASGPAACYGTAPRLWVSVPVPNSTTAS